MSRLTCCVARLLCLAESVLRLSARMKHHAERFLCLMSRLTCRVARFLCLAESVLSLAASVKCAGESVPRLTASVPRGEESMKCFMSCVLFRMAKRIPLANIFQEKSDAVRSRTASAALPIDRPRCCKCFNLHGSRFPQRLGAFVQGRASGENIIHQQDAPASDRLRLAQTERASQIAAPLCAVKLRLRHSGPVPLEQVRLNFLFPCRKAGFGQEQRLIEAPPAQAADVQRHGQNQIRLVEQGCGIRLFRQGSKGA